MIAVEKNPPQYVECVGMIMEAADRRGMVGRSQEQIEQLGPNGLMIQFGDPAPVNDESLLASLKDAAYTVCSVDPCASVGVQVAAAIQGTRFPNYLFVLTKPEHHAVWARRILGLTGRPGIHLISRHMDADMALDLSVTIALGVPASGSVH